MGALLPYRCVTKICKRDDQKRMDMLKAEHKRKEEIAQMDLSGEWSDSRGKEGEPWYVKVNDEEEDILGI